MNFNEYQSSAIKTWKAKDKPREEQLANAAFGIMGEAGEVVDIIKKMLYPSKPADKDLTALEKKMLDELGDLLYYVATMARLCGWSLETVAQHNADKLAERHFGGDNINRPGPYEPYAKPYDYTRIYNQNATIRQDKGKLAEAMEQEVDRFIQARIEATKAGQYTVAVDPAQEPNSILLTTGTPEGSIKVENVGRPEIDLGDRKPAPEPISALDEKFFDIQQTLQTIDKSLKAHDNHLARHEQEIDDLTSADDSAQLALTKANNAHAIAVEARNRVVIVERTISQSFELNPERIGDRIIEQFTKMLDSRLKEFRERMGHIEAGQAETVKTIEGILDDLQKHEGRLDSLYHSIRNNTQPHPSHWPLADKPWPLGKEPPPLVWKDTTTPPATTEG